MMKNKIRYRNSHLIDVAYQKLVLPDISAKVCGLLVTLVDSLIAARWIGISAVSAIALIAPVMCFEQCLHDFFVSGTTQILIRYKSRGQLEQANRAFGTILADTFAWYLLYYGLSFFWMKPFLRFFTQDATLIGDAFLYYLPFAVFTPILEAGLCLERGFKADGRNGFFGIRAVITNVTNILLSIAAVQLFNGGILGISIASNVASLLGYCWSASHFFSKQCTVRPDFSALRNRKEALGYLKEEREIGKVYALNDGMHSVVITFLNKAYLLTGGTAAIAAVGIAEAVINIIRYIGDAIQGSSFNLCGLFYSDRDLRGVALAMHKAIFWEIWVGVISWALVNLFPHQIGILYKVQTADVMDALRICLLFFTLTAIGDCFINLFNSFLIVTERTNTAGGFVIAHNVMILFSALLGFCRISFSWLLIACVISSSIIALTEAILIFRSGKALHEVNQEEVASASFVLSEDICAGISEKVAAALSSVPALSESIVQKAALLTEECSRLILYVNRKHHEEISADLRITAGKKECVITLIDTGEIFDPVHCLQKNDLPEEYTFSRQILLGFSPKATFARVVNLNVSHLILPSDPMQQQTTAEKEDQTNES